MPLVFNKTSLALTDLSKVTRIHLTGTELVTGNTGHAVACYHSPGVGYKLAEFSKVEDAEKCISKIQRHFAGIHDNDMYVNKLGALEIEDIVEKSLIQIAGKTTRPEIIR